MKSYIDEIIDLTGDPYLNPVPAVYDNGTHLRNVNTIKSISIHHDGTVRQHDYDSEIRYRIEAQQHYQRLGPGLQYHYKIDNVGQIFKIRPHETWLYVVGSAENTSTLAICLDGYFHAPNNQVPTREQYEALGQLLVKLCEQSPEFPATYPDVRPHRDFSATACPGDLLAPWVYAIQSKADVLNIPANAIYDWPEYQENTVIPPIPPVVTIPVAPAPVVSDPKPVDSVLPPRVTPIPPKPVETPSTDSQTVVSDQVVEGSKESVRIAILGGVSYLISLGLNYLTGLPSTEATVILTVVLKGIDKYIHENPNINLKGILPF